MDWDVVNGCQQELDEEVRIAKFVAGRNAHFVLVRVRIANVMLLVLGPGFGRILRP